MDQLWHGHKLLNGRRVTLAITASDLRPWRGRAHQFPILRQRRFVSLGTWSQVEAASTELVQELLAIEKQK